MIRTFHLVCLAICFLFVSCVPHRSYVATPFEPITVEKKGDMEGFASLRPFKYYNLGFTAAPANFMAIRASYGGFVSLHTANLSLIFFRNYSKLGFFAAPGCSYEYNKINRGSAGTSFNRDRTYNYKCEYISPVIALGLKLPTAKKFSHQLIVKMQYNFVNRYQYKYEETDYLAFNPGHYHIYEQETFGNNIRAFFSIEPSYVLLIRANKMLLFKAQLSGNFYEKTATNDYTFINNTYNGGAGNSNLQSIHSQHPKSRPFNLSLGVVFQLNTKEKRQD